ncbi:1-acyl-sn-glycerol-3-phosphate acyltransferase alpha-like [Gigantopelta aegis]|uniref:1-acyl-sn-glycerol-3-phosphate acyltransferase alpha-like n=1 Tax=Gigantopelta aegis TaxID=1735272 RepID=UPI001B88D35F|nr:1-acyl-sn-glycerol-3-phosphate acyltransferase alpha-like [Gigantopelta aegis]
MQVLQFNSDKNMALDFIQWFIIGLLLILPILYELSSTFKYYAKFFFYYALCMIMAPFVMVCSLPRPKDVNNYRYVAFCTKQIRKLFGIEIEVRGRENLVSNQPYILVSNHQSSIDFFGMMEIWPDRCTCLAKKELLYAGTFGIAAWLCDTIFIDRINHEKAVQTVARTADIIKKKNQKVYIFPEGTRNHDGSMLPFKKGAFHLAVTAQVPVVPVVFSSYSDFYSKREKKFETGKYIITCLPPVPTTGMSSSDVPEFAERLRKQMLEVYNQTSLETRQPKLINGVK